MNRDWIMWWALAMSILAMSGCVAQPVGIAPATANLGRAIAAVAIADIDLSMQRPALPDDLKKNTGSIPKEKPNAFSVNHPRAVLFYCDLSHCDQLRSEVRSLEADGFSIDFRDANRIQADCPPASGRTLPVVHFKGPGGNWLFRSGWAGPDEFQKYWNGLRAPAAKIPNQNQSQIAQLRSNGMCWNFQGDWHPSRQTMIEHLLTDGIHRGRYTRAQLNAASNETLIEWHDADHNGRRVAIYQCRPRARACPNGRCPL